MWLLLTIWGLPSSIFFFGGHQLCPSGNNPYFPGYFWLKEFLTPNFCNGFVRMEHMKMEMAREIEAMGIKLCCRWVCLLWVTPGKLAGGGSATASWWMGSNHV
jgi:hypothetical protein